MFLEIDKKHSSSSSSKIPDGFNPYPGRLLGNGAFLSFTGGPPFCSRLRGATKTVVPYTWLVLKCRSFCADCTHENSTATRGTKMSATIISAIVAEIIKTLSSREQWPDCAISQSDHSPHERHSVRVS